MKTRPVFITLLLIVLLWSVYPSPRLLAQTITPTPGAAIYPVYEVQFIAPDETLPIYADSNTDSPILGSLYVSDEIQSIGEVKAAGETLWLPVRTMFGDDVSGWINRLYIVQHIDHDTFCADERVLALVEEVREAVRNYDGERLAQTIVPARGLYIGNLYWERHIRLSESEVRDIFTSSTDYDWGEGWYTGPVKGTLPDVIVPMLRRDLLGSDVTTACYDSQDGLMGPGVYGAEDMDSLAFYSMMRPGAPGHEFDWGAWAFGIDYWDGEPTLAYLSSYFWTP